MQLNADRLLERLQAGALEAAYFFHGDEPLQLTELGDALRAAAQRAGIAERQVFDADTNADWEAILGESQAMSLFAERRLIEIRLGTRNPDKRGTEVLEQLAELPAGDDVYLVLAGALDGRSRKQRWFKALEQGMVCVGTRNPRPDQLPGWLDRRAARLGKRLTREAALLIADRVEGNLLAAAQEVEKLCLLVDAEHIDDATVVQAVTDSARFDIFQFTDALERSDAARALRVLRGLREEGTELPIVTWALGRALRPWAAMAAAVGRGANVDKVMGEYRIWDNRKPAVRRLLERHDADAMAGLLAYANFIDACAKGGRDGAPWDDLEILTLRLCGARGADALMAAI
ncbi:MAG: DNA polymerase III subunit delta [Gammaproteobacteria bacterium]|nr:DNA polymerase III subunit delta [Gammaproteobacteria bacterium]